MATLVDRALAAYRRSNPSGNIETPLSHFEASPRRLTAKTPVPFVTIVAAPLELEADAVGNKYTCTFAAGTGHFFPRLFGVSGYRFYGECQIAEPQLPTGATFVPTITEKPTHTSSNTIPLSYSSSIKRWWFVTSTIQAEPAHLVLEATAPGAQNQVQWTLFKMIILPFKAS